MFTIVLKLLTHRATYRFLVVLGAALGCTLLSADTIGQLEVALCSILTCSP